MKFLCRCVVCVFVFEFVFIRYQSAALSEWSWLGQKMSVLNTGVRLGEGWVGGSLLTLRCAEKLTHFYHGLKAPVCHTFDWSMLNVWLSDCIEIQILSTGAFRYGSTLAFTPAPRVTHLMDVLVWTSDWTQTNVHWTPFIQNWFLPIWHYWTQLESQSQVDMC